MSEFGSTSCRALARLLIATALTLSMVGAAGPVYGTEAPPESATTEPDTTEPDAIPTEPDPTPTEPDPTPTEPDPTPTEPDPTPTEPDPTPTEPFIVVAQSGTSAQEVKARAVALGVSVETLLEGVVEGIAVELTPEQRAKMATEPGVEYIERDTPVNVFSSPIRTNSGCTATSMGNIDDSSSGSVPLGFSVNWYGTAYEAVIINNNGGLTFDDALGDFRSYTGINLDTTLRPLVLPLFTDLDTTNSSPVTYGAITVDGKSALCVNWVNVGEYPASAARHSFQLVLINQGSGNVDLEFNYGQVTTPRATSNPTFVIGYADPDDRSNSLVRVRSTDSPTPYIDGGSSALVSNRFPDGAAQVGRYTYQIRPTVPLPDPSTPPATPTPGTANCTPTAQTPATWGLDRIDQRALPIDNSYRCAADGTGVRAYIVDTGIYANSDFSARLLTGVSYVPGESSTNDCNGHGTHVAGTVGGTKYGVAKNVSLIPVRVLNCSGSGYTSSVVSGLNWIAGLYDAGDPLHGTPAVVNMSLGGGVSKSTNDAVAALVLKGVTVVVAAGNSNADASGFSPASEPTAITVGSTTSTDSRSSFSNYGSLVDIFAPGSSIVSAWISSSTSTATLSGTSMAAPHVAGAAAVYLSLNNTATPAQVDTALKNVATANTVGNPGSGSPNLLLYARSFTVAPRLDSISPVSGSTTGGTTITVSGGNFTGTTGVSVGGTAATSFAVVSDSSLTLVTPPGSAGVGSISVTNASGTTALSNAFTYTDGSCTAPTISALSVSRGAADGTTAVTITGSGFTGASAVTFGGRPASFVVVSATSITTTAPANSVSEVNVVVSSSCGASSAVTPFAYLSPPTISYLNTDGGPTAGGTSIVINGAEFTTDSTVRFGGNAVTSLTYIGSTQLRVVTPAGTGTVNIVVTTPGGTATSTNAFSYYGAPTIASLSTTSGPATGSTGLRLFGTNLESTQSITFGGSSATFFVFAPTEIYVFTPARAAGTVDVVLTALGGTATLAGGFTYTAVASSGGGSSGGGGGSSGDTSGGGGAVADDEITRTETPVTTNQVARPGEFQIVDSAGAPLQLRRAELTSQGFAIAGSNWEITGQGPLNSTGQSVAPGQRMTISGSGLQRLTTTGIYILSNPVWVGAGIVGYDGNFTASFMIPQLPPGNHTLQINMVRQGQLPVSVALGMNLTGAGAAPAKSPLVSDSASVPKSPRADLVFFSPGSATLSKASLSKLRTLTSGGQVSGASVKVTGFTTAGSQGTSSTVAKRRAQAIVNYLARQGVTATLSVENGLSGVQGRSALIRISPLATAMSDNPDSVSALIVRYNKGVKPSGKPLTGVERVTGVSQSSLTLGPYLGLRMYLVQFAAPVPLSLAKKVAAQITKSTKVEFAEPDQIVSTQIALR